MPAAQYAEGIEPAKLKPLRGMLTDLEVRKVERYLREKGSRIPWPTPDVPDLIRTDEREARIFFACLVKALKPRVVIIDSFYEWCQKAQLPWTPG